MFANNLKDGLMFHTPWNCVLEWVTDVDSGILCKNLIERDLDERLDGFWNRHHRRRAELPRDRLRNDGRGLRPYG